MSKNFNHHLFVCDCAKYAFEPRSTEYQRYEYVSLCKREIEKKNLNVISCHGKRISVRECKSCRVREAVDVARVDVRE